MTTVGRPVIREQLDVIEKKFDTGTQRVDQKKFKL